MLFAEKKRKGKFLASQEGANLGYLPSLVKTLWAIFRREQKIFAGLLMKRSLMD
jgi:hypothetical protein